MPQMQRLRRRAPRHVDVELLPILVRIKNRVEIPTKTPHQNHTTATTQN